jgi:hypothetical protein
MHLRYRAFIPTVLAAFLVSCANTPTPSAPSNTAAAPTATAVGEGPEHALQKGMTAEAVKQIMGNPAEIKLMATTTGKAEVWVYRRSSSTPVRYVQVGTRSSKASAASGSNNSSNMAPLSVEEPVFAQLIEVADETVSLLMFDDKLVEQKTTSQKHLEYK